MVEVLNKEVFTLGGVNVTGLALATGIVGYILGKAMTKQA